MIMLRLVSSSRAFLVVSDSLYGTICEGGKAFEEGKGSRSEGCLDKYR